MNRSSVSGVGMLPRALVELRAARNQETFDVVEPNDTIFLPIDLVEVFGDESEACGVCLLSGQRSGMARVGGVERQFQLVLDLSTQCGALGRCRRRRPARFGRNPRIAPRLG